MPKAKTVTPKKSAKAAPKGGAGSAVKAKGNAKAKPAAKPTAKATQNAKAAAKEPAAKPAAARRKSPVAAKPAAADKPAKAAKPSKNGSTKAAAPKKRSITAERSPAPAVHIDVKAPFSGDELQKWRTLLIKRRQEIKQDISDLIKDAMEAEDGHIAPTHQADRGSGVDFQEFSLNMVDNEEEILWQIDRAIRKIDNGGRPLPFGVCEHTKQPIPRSRLNLLPWTPLSIEGASYMEQSGLSLYDMVIED